MSTRYNDLKTLQADLRAGQTTCTQLVEEQLTLIAEHQHLNAFVEVYADDARAQAKAIDDKIANGTAGKLAGMTLGVKDTIVQKGHTVQAASKILENFESLFTATALQRAIDEDAIVIGRLNCDEFAMGSSNENSSLGPVRNHVNPDYVPGGSSGGSAVAVAAGLCHASLGSDTGGSIRQPAAFCGIYGLKPTYGRISRYGLIAYGSSLDQIGPMTRSAYDAALLTEVMAGVDPNDNTSATNPVVAYSADTEAELSPKKLCIFKSVYEAQLDDSVKNTLDNYIDQLRTDGHTVDVVEFDLLDVVVPTYYVISTAEASANLSRYDGVRYGYRSETASSPDELYYNSRTEGFGPEVKRRIMLGTFVLSSGYYDAYYTKAQQVRRLIQQRTLELLKDYDFILSPTTPTPPFKLGDKVDDPIQMYLSDIFTVQANLAGVPGISFPAGTTDDGLPIGLQLVAAPFAESQLLNFAQHTSSLT